jgi:hypothetical protein
LLLIGSATTVSSGARKGQGQTILARKNRIENRCLTTGAKRRSYAGEPSEPEENLRGKPPKDEEEERGEANTLKRSRKVNLNGGTGQKPVQNPNRSIAGKRRLWREIQQYFYDHVFL